MSYTFTPKPSVARTARGRSTPASRGGAARPTGRMAVRPTGGAAQQAAASADQTDQPERVQRKDGFTMFAPDPKKRDQVARQAHGEEEKFKKYKETKKLGHVSYVGTAGGGLSEAEATCTKAQHNQRAAANKKATFQQHRNQEKQREQELFNQRKEAARVKSTQNETKESQRQVRLDEDRRRKNEEFLKRFEKGSKS